MSKKAIKEKQETLNRLYNTFIDKEYLKNHPMFIIDSKTEKIKKDIISEVCDKEGFRVAERIDEKMAIVIKPRKWYIPNWLYKKVIRDSVERIIVK